MDDIGKDEIIKVMYEYLKQIHVAVMNNSQSLEDIKKLLSEIDKELDESKEN